MRFEQRGDVWILTDEAAPVGANIIATLKSPAEVLALKGICEARLAGGNIMQPFEVSVANCRFRVTPYADRGGKLSLRVDGSDGSLSRVESEFLANS